MKVVGNERLGADEDQKEELGAKSDVPHSKKVLELKHDKAILLRKNKYLEKQVQSAEEEIRRLSEYNTNLCETLKFHDETEKQR